MSWLKNLFGFGKQRLQGNIHSTSKADNDIDKEPIQSCMRNKKISTGDTADKLRRIPVEEMNTLLKDLLTGMEIADEDKAVAEIQLEFVLEREQGLSKSYLSGKKFSEADIEKVLSINRDIWRKHKVNRDESEDRLCILLDEFDRITQVHEIGTFLNNHSQQELMAFAEAFPFSKLRLDYTSVEKDFRNCRRFESILHIASMLLRWDVYNSDPRWQGLLPKALDASTLYEKLHTPLFAFIKQQEGCDIAMVLRMHLYDFAMDLIRQDKNRDAMLCLEISRQSPREDHDFWLCACYHNVGKLEGDLEIIDRGIKLAKEIINENAAIPDTVRKKFQQTNLLENLTKMRSELA